MRERTFHGERGAKAESLYHQALDLKRKILGEEHPDVASCLNNLAILYGAINREVEAMILMKQVALINNQIIGQIFSSVSESTRMAYLKTLQGNIHSFLSLIVQSSCGSSTEVQAGLDLVLQRKAIGAEALAAQRDAVLGGQYPHLASQLRKLTNLRMQIGQKTLAGSGSGSFQAHQQRLAELNHQKEEQEAELARQIPEMNLTQKLRSVDRYAVANALPKDSVLVEFVHLDIFDFKAVPAQGGLRWQPPHYIAFVLPAQEPDNVFLIDLGQAAPINLMIATFRASITGENELDNYHREVLPDNSSPSEDILDVIGDNRHGRPYTVGYKTDVSNGTALRELLFDPLKVAIGDRKRLFLAPDGDLTRLPFEVLPTDDGRYLIDEYYISYLSTGRDVLRFEVPTTGQSTDPIVAADPDFDFADGDRIPASENTPLSGRQSRDLDRGGWHFTRLPGTRQEGEQIAKMLKVKPWIEQAVLEASLKACRSPRILHIATHGFFLPDQKRDFNSEQLSLQMIGGMNDKGWNRLSGVGLENPLLRSGLALAGANTWLKGSELHPEAEDNMLTAEDVSGLDLLDTELVVLSACETGLGHVHTGEGVFGLRRSFVLAGAKTLVMSLWKVPDQQTQELMEKFYRRLLEGRSRTDALRETQLEMKAKYPNPLYWGAFICQGDPKPLQKHDL
ncbi:CHAT domain-containing protein [Nostoc sp. CCY 9925]|uniref:CHAT domain-containing protein n=1 Tax=Nostoc sp. CCY 9925 TaxID=3103865 RepID=UPI0039C66866